MPISSVPDILKSGALLIAETASPLPLEHTQVNAHLSGLVASVRVNQRFSNPLEQPLELEYLFPLPQDAALVSFQIQIGQRLIYGDLRERQQAENAYDQARADGKLAALLEQQRPNLFSIHIANVRPGEVVEASIQYEDRLALRPGELEFIFPMGLTPRYHSPAHPNGIEKVNPVYAQPGERVGDVEIIITADPGFTTGTPSSPSHVLKIDPPTANRFSLCLDGSYIPDHDFVLRIPLAGKPVEIFARCGSDSAGIAALIDWLPGEGAAFQGAARPREFVFVLDRSGSMSGEPIQQARNALRACLRILEPQDTFRILLFDDRLEWYQPIALQVSQSAIQQADQYLDTIDGRGGTEIIPALEAALGLPCNEERVRYILFLTDGAVSAEDQALAALRQKLGRARIFTFGIGSSVNRALLAKMALWGRGTAEFLQLDEDIEGAILRFQDKVAFPMLTDISLEWVNCQAWDIYPALLPDLYSGQPLLLSARLKRSPQTDARLRIAGTRGTEVVRMEIALPAPDPDFPEAARLWARARVAELLDQTNSSGIPGHQVRHEIIGLALEHHLVTPFTAFVAVDNEVVNAKGEGMVLQVAQPQPKGLAHDLFAQLPTAGMGTPLPFQVVYSMTAPRMLADYTCAEAPEDLAAAPSPKMIHRRDANPARSMALPAASAPPPTGEVRETQSLNSADPQTILRWLARTQDLDGSWSNGIEFTAAALLAFVRSGNTLRRGYYRKQVRRAADWLAKAPAAGLEAFSRTLALAELGESDQDDAWIQIAKQLAAKLPAPKTDFERTVTAHLLGSSAQSTPPTQINRLDDLRLAAAHHLHPTPAPDWVSAHPDPLVKVWAAALFAEN